VFFADLPRREEELPFERHYDHPDSLPSHWLPGSCDVRSLVARTEGTVITVRVVGCYPRGLELELRAYTAPPDPDGMRDRATRHQGWEGDDLRVGIRWADGRRTETGRRRGDWRMGPDPVGEAGPTGFVLDMSGGSGGGLTYDFRYWLRPLPPPEPVELFVRWDSRGVPETSVTLDLSPAVAAADDAEELWHLPTFEEDPPEGGWFAYAPLGASVTAYGSTPTITPDDASGDALDGQDEDG